MRTRAITFAAAMWVVLAACGDEAGDAQTQLAVRNGGSASIDATVSDGETELSFTGIAAGTTSNFQTATFGSLSALTVTVGTQTSSAELSEGEQNVVHVGADGKVERVVHTPAPAGGGNDDGW